MTKTLYVVQWFREEDSEWITDIQYKNFHKTQMDAEAHEDRHIKKYPLDKTRIVERIKTETVVKHKKARK